MNDLNSRKHEIRQAAFKEFKREGFSGARLQAVADNIGVTKAMIHYYFKTKENLFREVYRTASETLLEDLFDILEEQISLFQKIEQFVDAVLNRLEQHPELAGFVINELNNHPEVTTEIFQKAKSIDFSLLDKQLKRAADNYEIAPTQRDQLMANLISLCIFTYTGGTFLKEILHEDDEQYQTFLAQRKEVIKDSIINWLAG